jgi:ferredoxin
MARISIDGMERELPDGSPILDTCEDLGVPFGCQAGECATCLVTVLEGGENLAPRTYPEQTIGLRANERLACQTKIISGRVVLTY